MSSSRESVVRREEGHPGRALGNMASLRLAKSLCDVTVQASGHQFDAHRVVLSASSAYFRAMFTGCMEESLQRVVVIRLVYKTYRRSLPSVIYVPFFAYVGTYLAQSLAN